MSRQRRPKALETIDDLIQDGRNANAGTDRGRAAVRSSLEELGAGRSVVVDRAGTVIAGNKTVEAAAAIGLPIRVVETDGSELVVVQRRDLSLAERAGTARRLAYADNRAGELGLSWDAAIVAEDAAEEGLLVGLFEEDELLALLDGLSEGARAEGLTDPDAVPDVPEVPVTQPGDLWILGDHRLLCGDATKAEDVRRLMGGERAVLFSTDPPYAVSYDGTNHPQGWKDRPTKNKDWSATYEDWDKVADPQALYDGFVQVAVAEALSDRAAWYCWHASVNASLVERAWETAGAFVHQQIIWAKDRPVLTRSHYMWKHEPCFFGWVRGKKPKRVAKEFLPTVWEVASISRAGRPEHPTAKPVELFRIPMLQHTRPGDVCFEPFSGSGSQLVAGEELGRRVFALEREPRYVDVAVARWEAFTGRKAERS